MKTFNETNKRKVANVIFHLYSINCENYILKILLNSLLWCATERTNTGDKYKGQPYWTESADELYNKNNSSKGLRHEHVVPRNEIIKRIEDLENKTTDNIYGILDKYAHAVIVTAEEDQKIRENGYLKKMPEEFEVAESINFQNILCRYSKCGIRVIDIKNKRFIN